ncbi:hypothetical protein ACWEO2_17820 [Nocardia sp. NPDC004278]
MGEVVVEFAEFLRSQRRGRESLCRFDDAGLAARSGDRGVFRAEGIQRSSENQTLGWADVVDAHGAYRVVLVEHARVCEAVVQVRTVVRIDGCWRVHEIARAAGTVSSMIIVRTHRHGWASHARCSPIQLSDTGTEPHSTAGHVTLINRFSPSNFARTQSAYSRTKPSTALVYLGVASW